MSEPNGTVFSSMDSVVTCGEHPFGTSHWAGTYNGFPAIVLSWFGGASLFYFDKEWTSIQFRSLADCYKSLGIIRR